MKDRNMDQMIMCAIYIMFKVTNTERNFQEIMKHYRNQPQALSHVYRSVLISRTGGSGNRSPSTNSTTSVSHNSSAESRRRCPPTPNQVLGLSSNFDTEERGDLIKFYNQVYVQVMRGYALKFRSAREVSYKKQLG